MSAPDIETVSVALARIEERQIANTARLEDSLMHQEKWRNAIDTRVMALERWRLYMLGSCAVIAFFARMGWDWIIGHH